MLLSDGSDTHWISPPFSKQLEWDRASGRIQTQILEAGIQLVASQLVPDSHQQKFKLIAIQWSPGNTMLRFITGRRITHAYFLSLSTLLNIFLSSAVCSNFNWNNAVWIKTQLGLINVLPPSHQYREPRTVQQHERWGCEWLQNQAPLQHKT